MKKTLATAFTFLNFSFSSFAGDAPCSLDAGGATGFSVAKALKLEKDYQLKTDSAVEFEVVVRLGRGAARGSHFRNIELVHVPMGVVVYRKEVSGVEYARGLSSARLGFLLEMPACAEARALARNGGISRR